MKTFHDLIESAKALAADQSLSLDDYIKKANVLLAEAEKYGCTPEIRYILKHRMVTKNAGNEEKFNYDNIPLRNPREVKAGAEWFLRNRPKIPFHKRAEMARKILQKGKEYNVGFDRSEEEKLMASACIGLCNKEIISAEIAKRAEHLRNRGQVKLAEILENLNREIQNEPYPERNGFAIKLAELIDRFDKKYHLFVKYGKTISMPEDFIFSQSIEPLVEVASLVGNIKTGRYYDSRDLESVRLTKEDCEALGDDFVKEATVAGTYFDIVGLKDWLKSADRDKANLFDVILNSKGIYHKAEKIPE